MVNRAMTAVSTGAAVPGVCPQIGVGRGGDHAHGHVEGLTHGHPEEDPGHDPLEGKLLRPGSNGEEVALSRE